MSRKCWKVFAVWASLAVLAGAAEVPGRVLRIGRATDKVERDHKRITALAGYLAARLGDVGVTRGQALLAPHDRHDTVIRYLKDGQLDVVIDSPFSAAQYWSKGAAFPLLGASAHGREYVTSVIIVRKDSGIRRLADLQGRTIAFQDPGSTASYYLPSYCLRSQGLRLLRLASFGLPVPKNQVGYVFARHELNISSWVYYGKVAGGALSRGNWENPEYTPERYRPELAIIHESPRVLYLLVLARQGLESRLAERLKEELLKINTAPEAAALRSAWIDRYILLPRGPDAEMARIRKMAAGAE